MTFATGASLYLEEPPVHWQYHSNVQVGMSLGWRNFAGTGGPIFKSADECLYGSTVAHLFQSGKIIPSMILSCSLDSIDQATFAKIRLNDALQKVVQAGDTVNQTSLQEDINSHRNKHNEVISKDYGIMSDYNSSNILGKSGRYTI